MNAIENDRGSVRGGAPEERGQAERNSILRRRVEHFQAKEGVAVLLSEGLDFRIHLRRVSAAVGLERTLEARQSTIDYLD